MIHIRSVYISELSPDDLRAFNQDTIEKILSDYMSHENPDFIRLRWFLRRLSQVGHGAAVDFCLSNFETLMPAISDVCHYFVSVSGNADMNWGNMGSKLLELLSNKIVQSNEYFQMSILALFNREPQLNHIPNLVGLYKSSSPFLRREIILAAAEAKQVDWIRELKEDVRSMDPWTKRAFIYSCRYLPLDERKLFLRSIPADPLLEQIIIDWAKG